MSVVYLADEGVGADKSRRLRQAAAAAGLDLVCADGLARAAEEIQEGSVEALLLGVDGAPERSLELLRWARARAGKLPLIVIGGSSGHTSEVLALGAQDHLLDEEIGSEALARSIRYSQERVQLVEQFRATFEQAAVGLFHLTLDGRLRRVNRKLCRMLGYRRHELVARAPEEIFRGSGRKAPQRLIAALSTGRIDNCSLEGRCYAKDGSALWARITLSLARLADGQPDYIIGVVEDVTEERASRFEQRRLAAALEQLPDSVSISDTDGKLVYVNPAFEAQTGYGRAEALGKSPRELLGDLHDRQFYTEIKETLDAGGAWSGHFTNRRKDGSLYEEEAIMTPVRDDTGEIVNFVGIKRDVTRERELEKQLLQAQKMEAVGKLAGGVAHDFNNLLTAISGYTELSLIEISPDSAARAYLSEIGEAVDRAASLIRQLLAFSRQQVLQPQVLDLTVVVRQFETLLRRTIGEDVAFDAMLQDEPWKVRADRGQIEQVLMNLAVNSRDAMPEGGTLVITVSNVVLDGSEIGQSVAVTPGQYVRLSVQDNGVGMGSEVRKSAFDPFFTTKEEGQGTGLGLSTAYGIVKQSDGFISIYSEPNEGTEVKVYLPRTLEGEVPDAGEEVVQPPSIEAVTILLAEDNAMVRDIVTSILEQHGHEVLVAADPEQALKIGAEHPGRIDLLLTDLVMPRIDGIELTRRIGEARPELRTLVMSGYAKQARFAADAALAGMPYIQKPFSAAALVKAVCEVLQAETPSSEDRVA